MLAFRPFLGNRRLGQGEPVILIYTRAAGGLPISGQDIEVNYSAPSGSGRHSVTTDRGGVAELPLPIGTSWVRVAPNPRSGSQWSPLMIERNLADGNQFQFVAQVAGAPAIAAAPSVVPTGIPTWALIAGAIAGGALLLTLVK